MTQPRKGAMIIRNVREFPAGTKPSGLCAGVQKTRPQLQT